MLYTGACCDTQSARKEGVRVLVDAEESRLQPAIHHLAVHHMMARYNHTEPVIYNTIQMYLKVCCVKPRGVVVRYHVTEFT